jgi:hypothetical protein
MGLRDIIGKAYGGVAVEWTDVGKHLKENYVKNRAELARKTAAQKRDAYYEGNGDTHIIALIAVAFRDLKNQRLRSDLVSQAKWNNVIKRVSHETATVYGDAPRRRIAGDAKRYKEFLDLYGHDAVMRELDRKLVFHDDVWVQYRVRKDINEPVLDVVSPASFWAVADPLDRTRLVAIIIDESPGGGANSYQPHYRVITPDETFMMDGECRVMTGTIVEHGHKRLPGVLVSTRPASAKGRLMSEAPAADLMAAHETVWFLNVLLVKESKSATKQMAVSGDTSTATLGQSSDTESELTLPEGVTTQVIDRGMDLSQFRDNADHILERAAANHGLPPSVLHHRDSSSGQEISLRRIPLRELRKQRIPIMRRTERLIAEIQSQVNASDLPDYAFDVEGWGIDFAEVEQPLTEAEQDAVFEKRRQLGLTDTLEEIRKRNPDLDSDEEAEEALKGHVEVETKRIEMMRDLMAMSGAMGSATPSAPKDKSGNPIESDEGEDQDTTLPKRK